MARGSDQFYRGKRSRRSSAVAVSVVLLFLIAVIALVFYGVQKFIVIRNDGLHLEFESAPSLSADSGTEPKRQFEEVRATLEIGETDYGNVKAVAGEGLSEFKAVFVPFDKVTQEGIAAASQSMGKADTLLLELKTAKGQLAYASQTDIARGYATAGELELKSVIAELHEREIKVAVSLSCFADDMLASRYQKLALKTNDGAVYTNDSGAWLDPTSSTVREYILSLCTELSKMGVDEIVLSQLRLPDPGEASFVFSGESRGEKTPESVISGFAMKLTRSLSSMGAGLSVQIHSSAAMSSLDSKSGQSAGFLLKLFDRAFTYSTADGATAEQSTVGGLISLGEKKCRYVPMCYDGRPETSSWVQMS